MPAEACSQGDSGINAEVWNDVENNQFNIQEKKNAFLQQIIRKS
jgi:hypothetical protein